MISVWQMAMKLTSWLPYFTEELFKHSVIVFNMTAQKQSFHRTWWSPIAWPNLDQALALDNMASHLTGSCDMSPRLLKTCSAEICGPPAHLHLQKVLSLWNTSCLVPVAKESHHTKYQDYKTRSSHHMSLWRLRGWSSRISEFLCQIKPYYSLLP